MQYIIRAENICRDFHTAAGTVRVLKNVSADIPSGRLTVLRGRSGSGKTTFLNILGALDDPTSGSVTFMDQRVDRMREKEKTLLRRRKMGFVFQSVALIPMMTVLENVNFALRVTSKMKSEQERAMECLHIVGLSQRAAHMPQQLSGGEQQRVAIARAIAHRPEVIFADEPTAALDTRTGLSVMKTFRSLCDEHQLTVVMTTHDQGLMEMADVIYEMEEGELTLV